jgi:hypothetical protein
VRNAIFIRPTILPARVLPVLIAVIGRPTIDPVAAFAMLVAIVLIPTLLSTTIDPVICVRAGGLNTIGRLVDADRIGARRKLIEAIGTVLAAQIRGNDTALAILQSHGNVGYARINSRGQEAITVAIEEHCTANAGL